MLGAIPAYPDQYSVNEDTTLTDRRGQRRSGERRAPQSGTLTVAVVDLPPHGTVTPHSPTARSPTRPPPITPAPTRFTYQATNTTSQQSNEALVTITVIGTNDAPIGVADSYTVAEDTTLTRTAGNRRVWPTTPIPTPTRKI